MNKQTTFPELLEYTDIAVNPMTDEVSFRNTQEGCTFAQYLENGRTVKKLIDDGQVDGTDYMIVGDIAVYCPYIGLLS
jgi:hypothetical protein